MSSVRRVHRPRGRHLFAAAHLPPGPPDGVVLVCSPLFVEAERNYRRDVLLARALARWGLACLRFHYRGTGNSDTLARVPPSTLAEVARRVAEVSLPACPP